MNRLLPRTALLAATLASLSLGGCVTITNTLTPERTVAVAAPAAQAQHASSASAACAACSGGHTCGIAPQSAYGMYDPRLYPMPPYDPRVSETPGYPSYDPRQPQWWPPYDPRYHPQYGYPGHYGYPQVIYVPVPEREWSSRETTRPRSGSGGLLGGTSSRSESSGGVPATRRGESGAGSGRDNRSVFGGVRAGERARARDGSDGASLHPDRADIPARTPRPDAERADAVVTPWPEPTAVPERRPDVRRPDAERVDVVTPVPEPVAQPEYRPMRETGARVTTGGARGPRADRTTASVAKNDAPSVTPATKPVAARPETLPASEPKGVEAATPRADRETKAAPTKRPVGATGPGEEKETEGDADEVEPSKTADGGTGGVRAE